MMSLLSSLRSGSFGFCFLRLFLLVMSSRMCGGRGQPLFLYDPFGMWCLSAFKMALVRVVLASWTLVGEGVSFSDCSMSSVKAVQFVLL